MPIEKISFQGHSGDTLAARLDMPKTPVKAYALFAHCFTCSKDIAAARRIASRLSEMGIAVLRFDFTGLGHSGGEFANTSFSSNVEDLVAAADWLRQNREAPSLLIGHSLGGAAVLASASKVPESKAVVTLGAPFDPEHVVHNFGCKLDDIAEHGEAEVSLAGRLFKIKKQFVDDVLKVDNTANIAKLKKALLVMHAPHDATVGVENATQIFMAAKHPKSFVTLDDADHLISRADDAEYAADVIASWSKRYLGIEDEEKPKGAPEGIVRASEADPDAFLQDIMAGPHKHILSDEPIAYGGQDIGLTPYQLLSAGLASCTSMTIRMVARRKGWPLDHVSVDVNHEKIHAADCDTCETKMGKVDVFERVIKLEGDLSPDQHAELIRIADRCPVHRTLESETKVLTRSA